MSHPDYIPTLRERFGDDAGRDAGDLTDEWRKRICAIIAGGAA